MTDMDVADRITARGPGPWIKAGIVEALRAEREACVLAIREGCIECEGSGLKSSVVMTAQPDNGAKCEYCGRAIAAIRARS